MERGDEGTEAVGGDPDYLCYYTWQAGQYRVALFGEFSAGDRWEEALARSGFLAEPLLGLQGGDLRVDVHVVRNRHFGDEVTVSGLIVGRDLLATLAGHELGDTLVLPRVMFDHGGTLTGDNRPTGGAVFRIELPASPSD